MTAGEVGGEEVGAWVRSLTDKDLFSLLERVSAEIKERNAALEALGGKRVEDVVGEIAAALLGGVRSG